MPARPTLSFRLIAYSLLCGGMVAGGYGIELVAASSGATLGGDGGAVTWGSEQGGLRSRIWSDRPQVGRKGNVGIHYEIQNASHEVKEIWHSGFWVNHRIEVTDLAGHSAALTRMGEQVRKINARGIAEKRYPISLQPGATDADWPAFNLRDYFVMDAPGKYLVHYEYQENVPPVVSNSITIVVAE